MSRRDDDRRDDSRHDDRTWWTDAPAEPAAAGTLLPMTAPSDGPSDRPSNGPYEGRGGDELSAGPRDRSLPRAGRMVTGRSVAPTVEMPLFVPHERPTAFPDPPDESDPWADLPATRATGLPLLPPPAPSATPTPALGLQVNPPGAAAGPPPRRRGRRVGALAASSAGVLLAVALVTAFVLRDGATDCRPQPLAAAPVAAVQPRAVAAPPIDTSWSSGIITFYGKATTGGACLASSVPANRYTAAAGPEQYANGAACGTYVDIKGRKGTIRVKITNLCPECPPGHLDLSDEAFAALDDMSKGRVSMSYRAVRNPSVGPLTVQVKDGSNPWWLAVRVDNHGNPLRSVEIASGSQGFQPMQLQGYGYWLDGNGAGDGPFRVRVTDVLGHRVTVSGIRLRPGAVQGTGVRLYGPGAGTAPRTTAPASRTRSATKAATAKGTAKATATATAKATATPSAVTSAPPTPSAPAPLPSAADAPTAGAALTAAPDRC